ncbi:uncharacterized protein TRAVEDRAFT_73070, partial [Trametes versicolor FP-101664 SS1]|uniref:uncharacterized protein n=1 Tax=Trametes versicolor (strain FP-101664) TaxID=717944 RepID=UPI000462470D
MNKPLLNDDVLLHIISFCDTMDRQTVCTLIRTSRLFHHAGARYLLVDGVSLCNEQVESFIQFMIADGDHRFPLLRTLTLSATTLPLFTGYILAQLFHRLARKGALCSLKLDDAESLLRSHPELPYAIAELPKLKSLCMYQSGRHGGTLMKLLRSELVYANLGTPYQVFMGRDDDGQIEDREDADAAVVDNDGPSQGDDDLITALHQSCQSLRELRMTFASDYSQAQTLVFPNLTSLTLHAGLLDAPVTGYFSCMFPNLKEFEVYTFNPDHKPFGILDFADRRDDNMDNQAECKRWRTLRYYDGTLEALFSLGIECRIDWVKLKSEDSALDPFMLSEALQEARPVHLCLEFWGVSSFLDEEFLEIFEEEGVERLETLEISVYAADGEEHLDAMGIL